MQRLERQRVEECVERVCGDSFLSTVTSPLTTDSARFVGGANEFRAAMEDLNYRILLERHASYRSALLEAEFGMSWLSRQHQKDLQIVHQLLTEQKVDKQIRSLLKKLNFPTRDQDGCEFAWQLYGTVTWVIMDRIYDIPENDSHSLLNEEKLILDGRLPCGWVGELPPLEARQGKLRDFSGLKLHQIVGPGVVLVI